MLLLKLRKKSTVTREILFWAKNGAITFKDSGKYDPSTGTTKSGKVNFGYKNYDKNDTVGSAAMMEGEITVYGGEYKVSAHSLQNRPRVIFGSAVKVYGGKFTADLPVVLSYTDKEGYGIFGGTFETLKDACCYINDPKVISNIKSGIFLNSSGISFTSGISSEKSGASIPSVSNSLVSISFVSNSFVSISSVYLR